MRPTSDAELADLQRQAFDYFLHETNPANGLVVDKTASDWLSSIAATGLALACYPASVERGFMTRSAAVQRTRATLRFFWNSPQGPEPDATANNNFVHPMHVHGGPFTVVARDGYTLAKDAQWRRPDDDSRSRGLKARLQCRCSCDGGSASTPWPPKHAVASALLRREDIDLGDPPRGGRRGPGL